MGEPGRRHRNKGSENPDDGDETDTCGNPARGGKEEARTETLAGHAGRFAGDGQKRLRNKARGGPSPAPKGEVCCGPAALRGMPDAQEQGGLLGRPMKECKTSWSRGDCGTCIRALAARQEE